METLAFMKLLFTAAWGVLLTIALFSFGKKKAGKNPGDSRSISPMIALLKSIVLCSASALTANAILRAAVVNGLYTPMTENASQLPVRDLLIFAGLTVFLCLIFAALIYVLFFRENRIKSWMRSANERQKKISFGKAESQAIKGIAILIMVFHHLFLSGRADGHPTSYFPFTEGLITNLAAFCKICVSLFAIVSGYGLFLSYRNKTISDTRWVCRRYFKTFSRVWFPLALAFLGCQLVNGRFVATYFSGNVWTYILSVLLDCLGLAHLFGTPSFLGVLWYLSAVIVFILITPLVCREQGEHLVLWLIGVVVFIRLISGGHTSEFYADYLGGSTPYTFLAAFLIGAILARRELFLRIINSPGRPLRLVIECILLIIAYRLYKHAPSYAYWELKWALFPALVVLFCAEFVIRIPGLKQVLLFLGRHSLNIYLVHNILRSYLKGFIYGQKHFALVFLLLLGLSLVCSIAIEALKKLLRYEEYMNRLPERIGRILPEKAALSD